MELIQVTDKKTENLFLTVARKIYKNDPFWVCQLDTDIKALFNPKLNRYFKEGDAIRWVLLDDNGEAVGRIAAFYNMSKAKAEKILTGGAGFFECVDNQSAANILFDAAGDWLTKNNMRAFDAPVNFGENDSNWGLLVEGFSHPGIGMAYHLPYYRNLFENYGFNLFFKQYSYHLDLTKKFPERFWNIAKWIGKKKDFTFRHFTWNQSEKFIQDIVHIYNVTWSKFKEDFTPLDSENMRESLKKAKSILDKEMIWIAYYKDEPISFFIMLPDANQILREMNGKLNLWNILRFLYLRETGKVTRIRAIVAGVVPKFQNSGVESGIFWHMNEKMKYKKQYKELELSWVGDFNPKMIALYEAVGGVKAKVHHTYRFMLDKTIPFERFMPEKVVQER